MAAPGPLDWRRYDALVLAAMELTPVEQESLPEGALLVRATFHPAFHADCGIEILVLGDVGELRLHVADAETRGWAMASIGVRGMGSPAQRPPPAYRTRADVPPARLHAFLRAIAALPPEALADVDDAERDGMEVLGALRDAAGLTAFRMQLTEARAPQAHARFLQAICNLAADLLPDEPSRRAIGDVRRYFPRS
jgi:hypothetical protein